MNMAFFPDYAFCLFGKISGYIQPKILKGKWPQNQLVIFFMCVEYNTE